MEKIFAILFILTGIFAIVGGLYTWGDGSIFQQNELIEVLIPWADIILTGPISILSAYGVLKKKHWGIILGLVTSGIYIFGSVLVFVSVIWKEYFALYLIIPALAGLIIGVSFVSWVLKHRLIETNATNFHK